jgi:PHD/YefM family antitoxin component YafN of YafNO toxin-antitoxin module
MKAAAKQRTVDRDYGQRESLIPVVQENGMTAYLVEAKSYEAMQRRLQLLEGLARGEKAVTEGRVVSHSRAKKRMARWLKWPRDIKRG